MKSQTQDSCDGISADSETLPITKNNIMIAAAFSVLLVVATTVGAIFVNDWDKPFDFRCPEGQVIIYISSVHENFYDDRRWEFVCRTVGFTRNCVSSGYVNEFDQPVTYTCPGNGVLAGVESYNDNFYEDRRFRFTCCDVSLKAPTECSTTGYINEFDGQMTLLVPEGSAIKSVYSWHDNFYEDRRWKVQICKV